MTHRIYKMTEAAWNAGTDWDTAIYNGDIETVEEFDSYEDAVAAFEAGSYDAEVYGVE